MFLNIVAHKSADVQFYESTTPCESAARSNKNVPAQHARINKNTLYTVDVHAKNGKLLTFYTYNKTISYFAKNSNFLRCLETA